MSLIHLPIRPQPKDVDIDKEACFRICFDMVTAQGSRFVEVSAVSGERLSYALVLLQEISDILYREIIGRHCEVLPI